MQILKSKIKIIYSFFRYFKTFIKLPLVDVGIGQMMALASNIEILEMITCCYRNALFENICKNALHVTGL